MKKLLNRTLSSALALALALSVSGSALASGTDLQDVAPEAWYSAAVAYCLENSVMTALDGGRFDPDGEMSRGEFYLALHQATGSPAAMFSASFVDVNAGDPFYEAVAWAKSVNLAGNGDRFAPQEAITRQEAFTVLYQALPYLNVTAGDADDLSRFADAASLSDSAREAAAGLVALGIVSGNGDGSLRPGDLLPRCQAAQLFSAALQMAGAGSASGIVEAEVEARILNHSAYVVNGSAVLDRRTGGETDTYTSSAENGASALYVTNGGTLTLDHITVSGNGTMSESDLSAEYASKYGYSAAILVNSPTAQVTLNDPTIVTGADSCANGAFASKGATLIVNGGTITTGNKLGHGLDATYGGNIYAYDTVIDTSGGNSGALATDFGGGFITGERLVLHTVQQGSPGIYTAGDSIITVTDTKITADGDAGVMAAHHNGVTNLNNCDVTGSFGLGGHNSLIAEFSTINMTGGTLTSTAAALLKEMGGRTIINLDGVTIGGIAPGCGLMENTGGDLVVNLKNMTAAGDVLAAEGSGRTELHLTAASLTGTVTATAVELDADSHWAVTGDSRVSTLTLADAKCISAEAPVTITYGESAAPLPQVKNVTFVQDDSAIYVESESDSTTPPPPPGDKPD